MNAYERNKVGGDILDCIIRDDVAVVFDIDGVLAPYEFGKESHSACDEEGWEEYIKENNPYARFRAIPQIRSFIRDKGVCGIYACSVAKDYERDGKAEFVSSAYGIPKEYIVFVDKKTDKIDVMRKLQEERGRYGQRIALVDDTVSTLDMVRAELGCITVHPSSFFFYES